LGFLLRQLRTERGLSIDEVTERAMFSATKLSRLETRRVGASPHDIRDLCIMDESAVRRCVGGSAVMRAQLERIIEVAGLPKVTFQLIPFAVGAHPGLDSNFVILEFGKPMVNDVVYVEGVVGNLYLESAAELERYRRIFSRLQTVALDPEGSVAMIERIAATYEGS
jgi:hypothetical protein